jgi:hydrogenase maturation protein HypF
MLPYTPLHYLLFYDPKAGGDFISGQSTFSSLVMTSGNVSEQPICKDNAEALEKLSSIADAFLIHDRDIHIQCDDSVVYALNGRRFFSRRSRGFAPTPLLLNSVDSDDTILAFGGGLKNTVCVLNSNRAVLSQHLGDVGNSDTFEAFKATIRHLTDVFECDPDIYACDLHPEYMATKYCQKLFDSDDGDEKKAIGVQHHHAHIASVMAEHKLTDPVIGFAMDGTGYGLDSNIWGGEVLLCAPDSFKRVAHLNYVSLPGGEKAVQEPWRMALSYIKQIHGFDWKASDLSCLEQIAPDQLELLSTAIDQQINCPQTSSLGRLFDAVASLLDLAHFAAYEGQAAIRLENQVKTESQTDPLPYRIRSEPIVFDHTNSWRPDINCETALDSLPGPDENLILDYSDTIRAIVDLSAQGRDPSFIAGAFHNTLVESLTETALRLRDSTGIETAALSGGCWQNRVLFSRFVQSLKQNGFRVFSNELVPLNDGGLSLGQAFVAAHSAKYL